MSSVELLLAAVSTLCGVIALLWRDRRALELENRTLHERRRHDQQRAAKIIFALLYARRRERGEQPPPTATNFEDFADEPDTQVTERAFLEAEAHARDELNGETEALLRNYLASTPTPPPSPGWGEIRKAQRGVDRTRG